MLKFLVILFFFSLLSLLTSISCDLVFPINFEDLDKPCNSFKTPGTYKLERDCVTSKEIIGYIESVGPTVCCLSTRKFPAPNEIKIVTKKTGDRSRKYCEENGSGLQSLLNFHIIGGKRSDVEEFPHMVAIGFPNLEGDIEFKCGGALISEKFIVTVAHCSSLKGVAPTIIRLGRVRL